VEKSISTRIGHVGETLVDYLTKKKLVTIADINEEKNEVK
jgi:hypothetical protein